jgi:putative transposase
MRVPHRLRVLANGAGFDFLSMKQKLERRYGFGDLHFITCSCYRRMPLLGTPRARDRFLTILSQVRDRYDFGLFGFVVMPEHIHLLISEPNVGNPSVMMSALKQRVSRALRGKKRRAAGAQRKLWDEPLLERYSHFWQRRFYDFNVWSERKKNEKLNYIHFNPVKRGLVERPRDWVWSSHGFYWNGDKGLCTPNPAWCSKEFLEASRRAAGMNPKPAPKAKSKRNSKPAPFARTKTAKGAAPTQL